MTFKVKIWQLCLTWAWLRRERFRRCWWSPARGRCTKCCAPHRRTSAQTKRLWSEFE